MEQGGGNKRRVVSASEGSEQPRIARNDDSGGATKKVFTRVTPTWLPHARTNKIKPSDDCHGSARRLEHGAERIQTISASQRKFAAQFSLSAVKTGTEGTADSRAPGGGRWAPEPGRPRENPGNPGGSPVGSRWSVNPSGRQVGFGHEPAPPMQGHYAQGVPGKYGSPRPRVDSDSRVDIGREGGAWVGGAGALAGGVSGRDSERRNVGAGGRGDGSRVGGRERAGGRGDLTDSCTKSASGNRATAGLVKGPWTREEDQRIIDCITQNITKWSEIAERVEGRVGKQCRERWFNHLDPSLKKSSWTQAEDDILVRGQARFGNSWTKIAKLLPGRSENAVKNRWNSAARKKGKTDPRANVADLAQMTAAVSTGGAMNSDFMGYPQVAMLPEHTGGGQMHYLMVPSFNPGHHVKTPNAPPAGWPVPCTDTQGHLRPMMHGAVPLNMLQAFPVHQHWSDQQAPAYGTPRVLHSDSLPEQGFGLLGPGQSPFGQPSIPSTGVMMTSRMSLGMGEHGQQRSSSQQPPPQLSAPQQVPPQHTASQQTQLSQQQLTQQQLSQQQLSQQTTPSISSPRVNATAVMASASASASASEIRFNTRVQTVTDSASKRELGASMLHCQSDGQAIGDAKGDSFFSPEDELSLSNTLFNLSLEQNSLGAFNGSFGRPEDDRQDSDEMGGSFGRQALLETRGSEPAQRGLLSGFDYGGRTASTRYSGDRGLNGHAATLGLQDGQRRQTPVDEAYRRPRIDFTTSVSELLFAPTQSRQGEVPL